MIEKWFQLIYDHRVSLRERMFRVAVGISMISLTLTMIMGRNITNLIILFVSLILTAGIVKISIHKECINTGATAIAILQFLLFPISFFAAGGVYSGLPQWFVICFIYISITLEGRRKAVFYLWWIIETVCFVIILLFIIRRRWRKIHRGIIFSVQQFPLFWWDCWQVPCFWR